MRLTFAKGTGKYDHLQIERGGLPLEMIQCPKQGIIPHDMIHYAVETHSARNSSSKPRKSRLIAV